MASPTIFLKLLAASTSFMKVVCEFDELRCLQILLTSWSAFPLLKVESVCKLCNQGKRIIFEKDLWRRFCFRKQSFREPLILTEYELNVSCYKIFFHILYFWWFWRCLSYTFFLMILKMQVRSNVIFMQVNKLSWNWPLIRVSNQTCLIWNMN